MFLKDLIGLQRSLVGITEESKLWKDENAILRKQREIDQNIMYISKWSINSDEIFKDSILFPYSRTI